MSDERHPSVSESAAAQIDSDLTRLLSIAPSAAFVPGVEQRIREQAARKPARFSWWIGLAAAAALVLAVSFGSRAWRTPPAPQQARHTNRTAIQPSVERPAMHPMAPEPEPRRIARHRTPHVPAFARGAAEPGPAQAEVLVSGDQLRAIARLQQLVAKGDMSENNLPPVGDGAAAATDIRPAPLTIAPLTVSAVETVTGGVAGSEGPSQR